MNSTASTANPQTRSSSTAPPSCHAVKGNLAPKRHHCLHTALYKASLNADHAVMR
jgi:hypothetical protein